MLVNPNIVCVMASVSENLLDGGPVSSLRRCQESLVPGPSERVCTKIRVALA